MPGLALVCASLLFGLAAAMSAPLEAERWRTRVVLVFGDGADRRSPEQVDALLADRDALAERDMLVIAVSGDQAAIRFGAPAGRASADQLRQAWNVAPGTPFAVILVGKDGTEKLRRAAPVPAADIFALIDSMPMRRSETR